MDVLDAHAAHEFFLKESQKSTKELVDEEHLKFQVEYVPVFQVLLPKLDGFFRKHAAAPNKNASSSSSFPAVDIGAGKAIGTVTLALNTRPLILHHGRELIWYASDWNGPPDKGDDDIEGPFETETRTCLRYLVQESEDLEPLFMDRNDQPIYLGDGIELNGLKAVQFNGRRGCIRGPDPNTAERFAVQVSPDPDVGYKSFKKENISYLGETTTHGASLRSLRVTRQAKEFFEGMLDRSREIDVLRHETWSNVLEELRGKCALVTCTSLLTCLGYRDPDAWKDTIQLASELLHSDGYLLQYDTMRYGGFGDTLAMQTVADDVGLQLDENRIPPNGEHGGEPRMIVLWKKK